MAFNQGALPAIGTRTDIHQPNTKDLGENKMLAELLRTSWKFMEVSSMS